jgi:hypothetical protein
MVTCDHCSDLLLDYLYGLLDEPEASELRTHVASCPACQAALAAAESQQSLLARAAQVYAEIRAFAPPSAADAREPAAAAPASPAPAAAEPAPATLPLPRRRLRRALAWLSAAAAVVLAALGIYEVYSYNEGLGQRQQQLAAARAELRQADQALAEAEGKYQVRLAALPADVQGDSLYVRVTGPASYSRSSAGQYHVLTRGPLGKAAPASVTLRLVDPVPSPGRTLFEQQLNSKGEQTFTLPAGLDVRPDAKLARLEVEVRGSGPRARARLEEAITIPAPVYASHLATSKPVYRTGEILFFRSLTLDRFRLTPPAEELRLRYSLLDPEGKSVFLSESRTRSGIAGGEVALAPDLREGDYTLQVSTATAPDPRGPQVLPESRRVRIVRADSPRLEFNRDRYAPGETGVASFRGRLSGGAAVPNQPVTVRAEVNGKPVPLSGSPPGQPLQLRTDAEGKAVIPFRVPPTMPQSSNAQLRMKVEVQDGQSKEKVATEATIAPGDRGAAAVTVEFFPEGGELVAGLRSRVYFEAQNAQGRPVALAARILDRQGHEVPQVWSESDFPGTGVFTFTPATGQQYRLETLPLGKGERPGPISVVPLPVVKAEGVVLSVAEAVAGEGAPLQVTVRDTVLGRDLLVVATCRGRLVDQRGIAASPEGATVELRPVPDTRGVVRVTVCERRTGTLVPLAERLVYRAPAKYLAISVAGTDSKATLRHPPASAVKLTAQIKRETGQAADGWLLATVVDEAVAGSAADGPAARFYLTRPVRHPQELEDANVVLADTPRTRQGLELFLGTRGWRRLVQSEQAGTATARLDGKEARTRALAGVPAVLIADNDEKAVQQAYEAELGRQRRALGQEAERTWAALTERRSGRAEEAALAARDLEHYEALPRQYVARGVTVLVLALFAAGGLFLVLGLIRVARAAGSAAPSFAAACAALALCVVTYLLTANLRTVGEAPGSSNPVAELAARPWRLPGLPLPAEADPADASKRDGRPGTSGAFHVLDEQARPTRPATGEVKASSQGAPGRELHEGSSAVANKGKTAEKGPGAPRQPADAHLAKMAGDKAKGKKGEAAEDRMKRRYTELMLLHRAAHARGDGKGGGFSGSVRPVAPGGAPPPMALPGTGGRGKEAKKADTPEDRGRSDVLVEYAHKHRSGAPDLQDTLFWHPALHAAGGQAHLHFDLADGARTYRLLLFGHDATGRLGTFQGKIKAGQ